MFFEIVDSDFILFFFFFQAEDGIRDKLVTGVQTCALPISGSVTHWRSWTPVPPPGGQRPRPPQEQAGDRRFPAVPLTDRGRAGCPSVAGVGDAAATAAPRPPAP